jgi:hypothetical protein
MSLRFAAAGSGECSVVARVLTTPPLRAAANDGEQALSRQQLLREALRHFAKHGLGAAERARRNAEVAFFAGDRAAYLHWMAIGRALDSRLADINPGTRTRDHR